MLTVVPRSREDDAWVDGLLRQRWGSTAIVSRGVLHDASRLPGLVCLAEGERVGLLTYHVDEAGLEVVTLDSAAEGRGVGTALLRAAQQAAEEAGCRHLWLITTNDNAPAQRFFTNRGLTLVAVHRDALAASRKLKPEIPLTGRDGVEIRDEIEFELGLPDAQAGC